MASEHPRMPSLRELKTEHDFRDLMHFHATLDAVEDAQADARELAKKKAEAAKRGHPPR